MSNNNYKKSFESKGYCLTSASKTEESSLYISKELMEQNPEWFANLILSDELFVNRIKLKKEYRKSNKNYNREPFELRKTIFICNATTWEERHKNKQDLKKIFLEKNFDFKLINFLKLLDKRNNTHQNIYLVMSHLEHIFYDYEKNDIKQDRYKLLIEKVILFSKKIIYEDLYLKERRKIRVELGISIVSIIIAFFSVLWSILK